MEVVCPQSLHTLTKVHDVISTDSTVINNDICKEIMFESQLMEV